MRLLRPAATVVAVTIAMLGLTASTAHAADSTNCDATSDPKVTATPFPGSLVKVWTIHTSGARYICFVLRDSTNSTRAAGAIVIRTSGGGATPPDVDLGSNPALCTSPTPGQTQDPISLNVRYGHTLASGTKTVCFTTNNTPMTTLTITVTDPTIGSAHTVEVWRDPGASELTSVACLVQFELEALTGNPAASQNYVTCIGQQTPDEIIGV